MSTPINFALTGVAGYVAPRYLKALKDTRSHLVAALDPFRLCRRPRQLFSRMRIFHRIRPL